jgi:acetyl-CoA carboxylase biotin carboxyl carrier protein
MSDPARESDDVFDVERIRRLVKLMEDHELREIDLRQSEQRIRLCRGIDADALLTPTAAPMMPAAAPVAPVPLTAESVAADEDHIAIVKSPMVGTFYSRANPTADPFVRVGDIVQPEKTICVIEAMKVFNEIPAEVRGKIVAVLVDDDEPVDHGRPLFKIDTSAV